MSEPRPWRRVHRGEEQDYRVLRVRQDTLEDPRDGSLHPRVIIDGADWVNVIPLTPDDQVVMVRQYRAGIAAATLELPGGLVEPGEPPQTAAARELEEETGYRAERLVPLGYTHPNPAVQTNRCFVFLGLRCLKATAGNPDAGEDLLVELHPHAEVPRLLREGHLTHALVVAAFMLEQVSLPPR